MRNLSKLSLLVVTSLVLLLIGYLAHADYLIYNKDGKPISIEATIPENITSLESRQEKFVECSADTKPEDVIVNSKGKILQREKSQAEKDLEKYNEEYSVEEKAIEQRVRKLAIDSLKAEGYNFKYDHLKEQ